MQSPAPPRKESWLSRMDESRVVLFIYVPGSLEVPRSTWHLGFMRQDETGTSHSSNLMFKEAQEERLESKAI